MDNATFAAERKGVLERADESLAPAVRTSLVRYWRTPTSDWESDILAEVARVWDATYSDEGGEVTEEAQVAKDAFISQIAERMEETGRPGDSLAERRIQAQRITRWLSTATINSATIAAAGTDGTLTWVTMRDSSVREMHRPLDGVEVPFGETFDVGGHALSYPGEPVGPPEVWIECRCVVRPGAGGEQMTVETVTLATEAEEPVVEVDEEGDPLVGDDVELEHRIPFRTVIAPMGKPTGDGRMFAPNSITWRDGGAPIALRWTPADVGGHDGAVRVGNFTRVWLEGDEVRGEGYFLDTPHLEPLMAMLVDAPLGVSVDLDNVVQSLRNADGSEFDMDAWGPGDPEPIRYVDEGRVAGVTVVDIPAYQEAYIALGPWEEGDETVVEEDALVAAGCLPCQAAALAEAGTDEEREAFEKALAAGLAAKWQIAASPNPERVGMLLADYQDGEADEELVAYAPGTKDGPGWITNPKETQRLRTYWTRGAGAAKIRWGQPGDFDRCRSQLRKYVKNPQHLAGTCANLHKVALGVWPGQEKGSRHSLESITAAGTPPWRLVSLTAAGGDAENLPPGEWFGDPKFTGPTPMVVTDEGQVYGHLATWGVCHISLGPSVGLDGECITAPHSQRDYAYFKTGYIRTDMGDIAVGNITMNAGHANLRLNLANTLKHYDNTATVVADINVGEDEYGIWFAGALRPDVTEDDIRALRASALSGDWRMAGKSQELVAALAVNVPGFPIVAPALAASGGHTTALVAAGMIQPAEPEEQPMAVIEAIDMAAFAAGVVKEMDRIRDRQARIYAAREAAHKARLALVRRRLSL